MPNKKETTGTPLRIVVLGSSGVGKSAIVMQYVRGVFIESYDPTLEDSFTKRVHLGGHYEPIDAEILDTAGTDQFAAMRDMYIGSGDVFLLVYSVDSKASFNEACHLYNRIKAIKNKKVQVINLYFHIYYF
jgi:Ras-related protein Rap-1B